MSALPPVIVPVSLDTPCYTERVTLDGQDYTLRFDWNGREGRWYLDIGDVNGNWIVTGIKIICDWPLTRRQVDQNKPPGDFIAIDFSNMGGEPPGLPDLGRRVQLFYYPVSS